MPVRSPSAPAGFDRLSGRDPRARLLSVDLDAETIGPGTVDQAHERRVAIADLIDNGVFALPHHPGGPYRMVIALQDWRLAMDIRGQDGRPLIVHVLSLAPFRPLLKDYAFLCGRHHAALRTATPAQIEAIDMGRRGLHNEAAELLGDRLAGKIVSDFDTMRRLFTLLAALHRQG